MTLQRLDEYPYLEMEVEYYSSQIERWKNKPLMGCNARQRAEYTKAVQELVGFYEMARNQKRKELDQIQSFFDNIAEPMYQKLFCLRYKRRLGWTEIWGKMSDAGYYYGADSYRILCSRYIEKYNRGLTE